MAENNIIQINSSLAVTAAEALDYSTLLVVDCNHNSFSRATVYGSPDDYSTTLLATSNLRKALDSAFSASVRPPRVIAGRAKGTAVLSFPSVGDGDIFDFTVTTEDGGTVAASFIAGALDTAEEVATALKADIDLVTDVTDHVTATVVGTGASATLELSLVASTDDFTVTNITDTITITGVATEPASNTLAAIREINSAWTYIVATDHTPAYQLAMAQAATVLQKPYATSTARAEAYAAWDGVSTPDSNDVAALFAFNQFDYAHVVYHHLADNDGVAGTIAYPEAARITEFVFLKPGRDSFQYNKIGTFPLAQIVGGARPLNTNELFNLNDKNASTVISFGGVSVIGGYEGGGNRMASGIRIETIAVKNYFEQEILRKTQTLFLRFRKLAMNDSDINLFRNTWASFLDQNVSSGAGQAAALEPIKPYTIIMPRAADIPFEDKADGILQNTTIICYLDPSIDRVVLNMNFTFSDPVLEAA